MDKLGVDTQSTKESSPTKITLKDLSKCLEEERTPNFEDLYLDFDDQADYSADSSISSEDSQSSPKKALDTDFADLGDMMVNPFADVPEFYSQQLDFGEVEGLPGTQRTQEQHLRKSVLKNKYWRKVVRSVYDIGTTRVRAQHLTRMLDLYVINQEKGKEKRKNQGRVRFQRKDLSRNEDFFKSVIVKKPPLSSVDVKRRSTRNVSMFKVKANYNSPHPRELTLPGSRSQVTYSTSERRQQTMATTVASAEIRRRIETLDKKNCKVEPEKLSHESKCMMLRMPTYSDQPLSMSPLHSQLKFPKMLVDYLLSEGYIGKWKQS